MNDISITEENPARLLIVDDEPLIRKILIKYLGDKNYIIETAEDGSSALKKLDSMEFDLVLTDLRMPNMGGRELLQIMSGNYPEIPKIVLTGYGTNEDIIIALKTGAYDFLTKPITDFTILEHSIERGIEKKRLNDKNKKYTDQLKQINEVISMLNSGKSTEDIFNTLNIILKKNIPFNRLSLSTLDSDNILVSIKLVESDRETLLNAGDSFLIRDSPLEQAYESKTFLNLHDLISKSSEYPDSICVQSYIDEGMKSSLILPLIVNNKIRGFLQFASDREDSFKRDHITFLESIVGQIALSIQRGELLFEIEQHTRNLEELVELRSDQIISTQKTTIFALSKLAEARDTETGDHLERIRDYSVKLANILKISCNHNEITERFLRDLHDSSILHDIGKVGIPDGILLKEGFLSEAEYEIMKTHTTIGYEALKSATKDLGSDSFLNMAMDITLYHHEQWDGKGYPRGLKGDETPLSARIIAVVDVYDALTSKRPYKDSFTHKKSIDIMKKEAVRFDPEIFKNFLENHGEFNSIRLHCLENENTGI